MKRWSCRNIDDLLSWSSLRDLCMCNVGDCNFIINCQTSMYWTTTVIWLSIWTLLETTEEKTSKQSDVITSLGWTLNRISMLQSYSLLQTWDDEEIDLDSASKGESISHNPPGNIRVNKIDAEQGLQLKEGYMNSRSLFYICGVYAIFFYSYHYIIVCWRACLINWVAAPELASTRINSSISRHPDKIDYSQTYWTCWSAMLARPSVVLLGRQGDICLDTADRPA